jgi:hypothetical protein
MENLALEVTDAGDLGAAGSWHAAFEAVERVPCARAIAKSSASTLSGKREARVSRKPGTRGLPRSQHGQQLLFEASLA